MFETILTTAYMIHTFTSPGTSYYTAPHSYFDAPGELTVQLQHTGVRTIQRGSQRVPMLHLTASASCEQDVPLYGLTLRKRGLGDPRDISAVYLAYQGQRISTGRRPSTRGIVNVHLRNVTIPACKSIDFEVLADFSPDAAIAGEHWFTIDNGAQVDADAGRIVIERSPHSPPRPRTTAGLRTGVISVEYPRLTNRVRYGENQTVARLTLNADGSSDHVLRSILLTNEGTARGLDLQNIYLSTSQNRVTTVAPRMNGDTVHLTFDPPLLLEKNDSRTFSLRADIRASRRRTLRFVLEEPSDLVTQSVR